MFKVFVVLLSLFLLQTGLKAGAIDSSQTISNQLRLFIDNKSPKTRYTIDREELYSSQVLPRFYVSNSYVPAWLKFDHLSHQARLFIEYIEKTDEHGLQPSDYHLEIINKYRSSLGAYNPNLLEHLVKLDLLLTDAYLLLSAHLNFGKVDSERLKADWKIQRNAPELLLDERLKESLKNKTLIAFLDNLPGQSYQYKPLKKQLAFFKTLLTKKWPVIKFKITIHPNDTLEDVIQIRKKLNTLGYSIKDTISPVYDIALKIEVQKFQNQHGLNDDGSIGKLTMDAFNLSPASRVNQIIANLERMRWMPANMPERRIEVNIADYKMLVINGKDTVISSRAIVGKSYRKTPVFNSTMTYLVVCPTWVVPPTILANDVLPELKKGSGYLTKKNMKIISYSGQTIPYSSINWSSISASNFPYMIRQSSGPDNALGNIKFMFPNEYNVYIHDTPSRELFDKDSRAFSSGCIRIQKPIELALYLLADKPEWTEARLKEVIASNKEQTLRLSEGMPVYITYFTAWATEKNHFHFRTDLYNRDVDLLKALKEKPKVK